MQVPKNRTIKLILNCVSYVKNPVARLLYQQKMEEKRSLKQLLYAKMKFC